MENRELIEGVSIKAALLAERFYGDYLEVYSFKDDLQGRADFNLAINAVVEEDQEVIQVSLKAGNGEQVKSFAMVGGINRDTPLFLSRVVFYLWSSFHDYLSHENRKPAEWVDELTTGSVFTHLKVKSWIVLCHWSMTTQALVLSPWQCIETGVLFSTIHRASSIVSTGGEYHCGVFLNCLDWKGMSPCPRQRSLPWIAGKG